MKPLLLSPQLHLAQIHLCPSVGWLSFFILISGFFLLRRKGKKMWLMIFIWNCTAVRSEKKNNDRRLLSRRQLISAAQWRKKEINLIKLCVIFRLWAPPLFGLNTSRVARMEKKPNLVQVKEITSTDKRLIIWIWLIVMTVITATETSRLAS